LLRYRLKRMKVSLGDSFRFGRDRTSAYSLHPNDVAQDGAC
jgi:hypothetical protein